MLLWKEVDPGTGSSVVPYCTGFHRRVSDIPAEPARDDRQFEFGGPTMRRNLRKATQHRCRLEMHPSTCLSGIEHKGLVAPYRQYVVVHGACAATQSLSANSSPWALLHSNCRMSLRTPPY